MNRQALATAVCLCLLAHITCHQLAQSSSAAPAAPSDQQARLASSAAGGNSSIADMRKSVFEFWLQHGPGTQYGGFHATLDRQSNAIDPTSKTIVQQVSDHSCTKHR